MSTGAGTNGSRLDSYQDLIVVFDTPPARGITHGWWRKNRLKQSWQGSSRSSPNERVLLVVCGSGKPFCIYTACRRITDRSVKTQIERALIQMGSD